MRRRAGLLRFNRIALGIDVNGLRFPARADNRLEEALRRRARELEGEGDRDMKENRQKGERLRGAHPRPEPLNSLSICRDRPHKSDITPHERGTP